MRYQYTYTEGPLEHHLDPVRRQRDDWAIEWCKVIAEEVGGLDMSGHQRLFLIIHEIRKRVEAGDYMHPARLGPPKPFV